MKNASRLKLLFLKEKSDDNKERERRRSQVQIRKRLSNVAQAASPANESVVASQEEINGHVQICIKLFAENVG